MANLQEKILTYRPFGEVESFPRNRTLLDTSTSVMTATFDLVSLILALYASVMLGNYLSEVLGTTPISIDYLIATKRDQLYLAICAAVLLLFYGKGHYTQRIPWWTQIQFICRVMMYAVLIDGFLSFATELRFSRMLILLNWGFGFIFILFGRQIVQLILRKSGTGRIPSVIIGDIATVTDVLYALTSDPSTGYDPKIVLLREKYLEDFKRDNLPKRFRKIQVLDGLKHYHAFIRHHQEKFFLVSLETFQGSQRDAILAILNNAQAQYAIIPSIKHMSIYEMEPRYYFGNDVMLLHATPSVPSPMRNLIKRGLDIIVASLALLILSPIFLIAGIMLKLEGQKGSVLYGGKRIGRNGARFRCWKFRTMDADSEHLLKEYLDRYPLAKAHWEKYRKLPRDPRVNTHTARILRKLSIDELPQLWNVLKGDMSIVGPRPILEDETDYFGDKLNEYLSVKPGITGLWQVSGRNAVSFERRVYWDSWYVRNWSLWGDTVIMLKTLPALMRRADAS